MIILSGLYRAQFLSFQYLKDLTKIKSDGNLASHLRALEKQGLTGYHKGLAGRRTITFYFLTKEGKEVFQELMVGLKKFLEGYKK